MGVIINRRMSPADRARLENAEAAAARNADIIEYVAMMADIEIPIEEGDDDDEQEV